jgi:Dolichyl-phosphate-mannose-protein mannosyltransferase
MPETARLPSNETTDDRRVGPSRRLTAILVVALLALMGVLLVTSVRQESQTFDESSHLFAGFEYWKHADFGRNPEHPPLAKLLASLPLLSMALKEPPVVPIPYFKGQDFVNSSQFLYSGDADGMLLRGRMVIALFSVALGFLVFVAAREMFDPLTALLALGLFAFEPVLLANGALVTTDMPLACLFFASVYTFYRYIKRPSLSRLAICAAAAALTIVTKHSGLLIVPTLVLLACVEIFARRFGSVDEVPPEAWDRRRHLRQFALAFVVICVASYFLLWAIYGFRYAARPGQLQMIPTLASYSAGLKHPLQQAVITFMARHHLLPEAYLYGWVDILLIPGTRSTFLFGHVFGTGQWFFFPAVFLVKTTLTLLALLLLAPFAGIRDRRRELLFLTIPIGFFFGVAIVSMLNLGVRHLLPIYPFCIVLGAAAAGSLVRRSVAGRVVVTALLVLTVVSAMRSFPDFLAYSNEIAGGPSRTYLVVTDSNADWGQGLKWTKRYLDQHPAPECWFDSYNPLVPVSYYGVQCKPLLTGMGHLVGIGPPGTTPSTISGVVLVSATETSGILWGPDTLNPYATFRDRQPDAKIGDVVLVYHGSFDVPLLAAQSKATSAGGLLRQHRFPEAVALAQDAVQLAPDSAEVNAVLGQALLASGREEEGKQANAKALHLAQTIHPDYQRYLIERLQKPNGGS